MLPTATTIDDILGRHEPRQEALLPILHDIQDALGHIPAEAETAIARVLALSRAEVHGVISYYHHFRQAPPGKHVVRVCCAEACQANGAEALAAHAQARGATAGVTVEPVYCLGMCAIGPAVQIDETELHARVTPERFDALVAALEADR